MIKGILNLFANLALVTATNNNKKCAWMYYQEKLPDEFYEMEKLKKHEN